MRSENSQRRIRQLIVLSLLVLLFPLAIQAQEQDEAGQRAFGVIHNIAEDRKIERVGGIYEPEGLDKYMKRRFDEVDARLNAIQGEVSQVLEKIGHLEKALQEKEAEEAVLVSGGNI